MDLYRWIRRFYIQLICQVCIDQYMYIDLSRGRAMATLLFFKSVSLSRNGSHPNSNGMFIQLSSWAGPRAWHSFLESELRCSHLVGSSSSLAPVISLLFQFVIVSIMSLSGLSAPVLAGSRSSSPSSSSSSSSSSVSSSFFFFTTWMAPDSRQSVSALPFRVVRCL